MDWLSEDVEWYSQYEFDTEEAILEDALRK